MSVFRISKDSSVDGKLSATLVSQIVASSKLGEFGSSLAVSADGVVAVGSPAYGSGLHLRAGRVNLLDLAAVVSHSAAAINVDASPPAGVVKAELRGPTIFSRFGYTVRFLRGGGLAVGAPLANGMLLLNDRERGEVRDWMN